MKKMTLVLILPLSLVWMACNPKDDSNSAAPAPIAAPASTPVPNPQPEPEVQPQSQPQVQPEKPSAAGDGSGDNQEHHQDPAAPAPQDTEETVDPLVSADLLKVQRQEVRNLTATQIQALNDQTIAKLYQLVAPTAVAVGSRVKRVSEITPEVGQKLINSMNEHPVVSYYAKGRYDQPGTEIGYCFGRATYAHLALLKMGVAKESIRKVWLVGPMLSSNIQWAFHVAVVVRVNNGKWMVVDNFTGRLLEVKDWAANFYPFNKEYKNLRLYITNPSKFSVSLGKYSRVQMGLDLTAEQDWYRHYFADLMDWFQHHDMSEMGLPSDLRKP